MIVLMVAGADRHRDSTEVRALAYGTRLREALG